jgi:hypothetical protein
MSLDLTPQQIFNAVLFDEAPVSVLDISRNEYESMRVSLIRRFKTYKSTALNFDAEGYADKYIQASYDAPARKGTFSLQTMELRLRKRYTVEVLPENL